MPDLGTKYECTSCATKFYDLGRAEPNCPKCGLNPLAEESEEPVEEPAKKPAKKPAEAPGGKAPAEAEVEAAEEVGDDTKPDEEE